MSNLGEKVSYIKGLAEGMKIDAESGEGKLIVQMIDVLSEAAKQIAELHEAYQELNDYVECIDDDLEALEVRFDGEDEDDDLDDEFDFEDDDADEDGCGKACDGKCVFDDEDENDEVVDEDDEEVELIDDDMGMYVGCLCPECNGMFCVDASEIEDDQLFLCPHCGAKVSGIPMDNQSVPVAQAIEDEDE